MDPMTIAAIASAIYSGYNSYQGQNAAREGADRMNALTEQQLALAKAGRTDAYGNKTVYDPYSNEWKTQLTPEEANLVFAGERENRLNLTEDATRNREILRQQRTRGLQANEDYNTARAGYQYAPRKSEGAIQDEITRLIQEARGTGDRALGTLVNRQMLRQKGNMPVINVAGANPDPGAKLAQTMLDARNQAIGEVGTREQQRQERYLKPAQQFQQTADMGSTQIRDPQRAQEINQREDALTQQLQAVMQAIAGERQGATNTLASTYLKSGPTVRDIASLISASNRSGGRQTNVPNARANTSGPLYNDDPSSYRGSNGQTPGLVTPYQDPWFESGQSNPGDSFYF